MLKITYTNIECIAEKIEGFDCRLLLRKEGKIPLVVIGLNPSTADESIPDATMRKIMGFINTWNNCGDSNFDSFIMLNLYPHRETSPRELKRRYQSINETVHNHNMDIISTILDSHPKADVLLCYGDSIEIVPWMKKCREEVLKLLIQYPNIHLRCLGGLTNKKNPRHPCRLSYSTKLEYFQNPFSEPV